MISDILMQVLSEAGTSNNVECLIASLLQTFFCEYLKPSVLSVDELSAY